MKYTKDKAFDYENGFILTSDTYRLGNILSHYELYKKIINLPGDVVEFGVFKGNSIIQFATFRELLENEHSRKIVGFDMFGNFPHRREARGGGIASDKKFIDKWNEQFDNEFLSKDEIAQAISDKNIGNVELIEGNILDTLEPYIEKNPQLRIALLHIDVDVYEPAKFALNKLFNRIVRGGVVVFDDYATIEGETLAVEEFFSDMPEYKLQKFTFSHTKPSYIIKN